MSDDWKERVRRAAEAYITKHTQKPTTAAGEPKRKNQSPEKLVERTCLEWMRAQGWDVQIFEAKATFDPVRGVWRNQAMKAGTCDCMGNMPSGHGVAVEFKAPGRLSAFALERNHRQRQFIERKIATGVFACVVDSLAMLRSIYGHWRGFQDKGDFEGAKRFLHSVLPRQKAGRDKPFTMGAE